MCARKYPGSGLKPDARPRTHRRACSALLRQYATLLLGLHVHGIARVVTENGYRGTRYTPRTFMALCSEMLFGCMILLKCANPCTLHHHTRADACIRKVLIVNHDDVFRRRCLGTIARVVFAAALRSSTVLARTGCWRRLRGDRRQREQSLQRSLRTPGSGTPHAHAAVRDRREWQQRHSQGPHTHAQSQVTYAPAVRRTEHCRAARTQPAATARSAATAARPMEHYQAARTQPAATVRSAAPAVRPTEHCPAARTQPAATARSAAPAARPMEHFRAARPQPAATARSAASSAHNHALHACTYTHNTTTWYLRARPERRRLQPRKPLQAALRAPMFKCQCAF